eukprot:1195636-Prorocentrum_minimum.AAC.4
MQDSAVTVTGTGRSGQLTAILALGGKGGRHGTGAHQGPVAQGQHRPDAKLRVGGSGASGPGSDAEQLVPALRVLSRPMSDPLPLERARDGARATSPIRAKGRPPARPREEAKAWWQGEGS